MAEGTFTYENQWRGLYAGRPEEQKLVNVNALGTLIGEHASLLAEVQRLRDALEPFAAYYKHYTAKGIKTAPPPLGPAQYDAAIKALAEEADRG